jgi:hypothetical protein
MRAAVNRNSSASDPVGIAMSDAKLKRLSPSLYPSSGVLGLVRCLFLDGLATRFYIRDMLVHGDSRAAVVVMTDPLLVATYCDDLDAVCVLRFPPSFVEEYRLQRDTKLLTVLNSFSLASPARPEQVSPDLVSGPHANPYYVGVWPLVAEFLSDDLDRIEMRKARIGEREYEHCRRLGEDHLKRFGGIARPGRPDWSLFAEKVARPPTTSLSSDR